MPKEAQFCVIWDLGGSVTVTLHRSDFVGHHTKPLISIRLKGLAKRPCHVVDNGYHGMLRAFKVPAYHVPGCNIHILSTSSLWQMYPAETISLVKGKLALSGESGQLTHGPVIALVGPTNNLPTSQTYS
jgi:hypothetical protein